MKHASFSFKIHKNESTEKAWGFYAQHILCNSPLSHLQTCHPFCIYVKWVGYLLPLSHVIPMSPSTPLTCYSSNHPLRLVSVSSSQCCQVILYDMPIVWRLSTLSLSAISSFVPFLMCQYPCFMSIEKGFLNSFLRWISSCRFQQIIRDWNLETY